MKIIQFFIILSFPCFLSAQITEEWLDKGLEEIPVIASLDLSSSRDLISEQNIKNLLMPPRKPTSLDNSMYYALASALEFYINLNGNFKINLSPEYIRFNLPFEKQNLPDALEFLKETGTISAALLPYDSKNMSIVTPHIEHYRIERYLSLFLPDFKNRHKIFSTKKALLRGNPVIVSIRVNAHFLSLSNHDRYWSPEDGDTTPKGVQTLLAVGYDEDKEAFEFINFQGSEWGYRGCIWIEYEDFADYVEAGMVVIPANTVK